MRTDRSADYREFIKLPRLSSFRLDDFQKQIRDAISRYVKDTVANNIPVIQIETKTAQSNNDFYKSWEKKLKLKN